MFKLFIYFKDLLQLLFPFFLIWLYGKKIYGVGVFEAVKWWVNNCKSVDFVGVFLLGLFFSVFAFFATYSHLSQAVVLKYFGAYHDMVYLGNSTEKNNEYLKEVNGVRKYYTVPISDDYYNFSLANIFKKVKFKKEFGTDRVGSLAQGFSIYSVLVSLLLFVVFLTPLLISLHVFFFLPGTEAADSFFYSEMLSKSFDEYFLNPMNLSRKALGLGVFGIMVLLALLMQFKPSREYGVRSYDLPFKQGDKVTAKPLYVKRIYNNRPANNGSYINEDSGYRVLVLKISDISPLPIWVSTMIDSRKSTSMEKSIKEKIQVGQDVVILIGKDYSVSLDDEVVVLNGN